MLWLLVNEAYRKLTYDFLHVTKFWILICIQWILIGVNANFVQGPFFVFNKRITNFPKRYASVINESALTEQDQGFLLLITVLILSKVVIIHREWSTSYNIATYQLTMSSQRNLDVKRITCHWIAQRNPRIVWNIKHIQKLNSSQLLFLLRSSADFFEKQLNLFSHGNGAILSWLFFGIKNHSVYVTLFSRPVYEFALIWLLNTKRLKFAHDLLSKWGVGDSSIDHCKQKN